MLNIMLSYGLTRFIPATPLSVMVVFYSASVYLCHLDPWCFYYHLPRIAGTFASTAAAPLLPAPAPVPRVLALLLLPPRPPHTRPGTGAHTRVAQHELHSKCQPHPAAVHHKTARARRSRRPDPCVPRTAPREPQRPTSTASCAMHCTPRTQDLQRQAR